VGKKTGSTEAREKETNHIRRTKDGKVQDLHGSLRGTMKKKAGKRKHFTWTKDHSPNYPGHGEGEEEGLKQRKGSTTNGKWQNATYIDKKKVTRQKREREAAVRES